MERGITRAEYEGLSKIYDLKAQFDDYIKMLRYVVEKKGVAYVDYQDVEWHISKKEEGLSQIIYKQNKVKKEKQCEIKRSNQTMSS